MIIIKIWFSSILRGEKSRSGPWPGGLLLGFPVLTLGIAACASGGKNVVRMDPVTAEVQAQIAQADVLVARGHYTAFEKAAAIYREISKNPGHAQRVAFSRLRTLVLLRIRERQTGIQKSATGDEARAVVRAHSSLRMLAPFVDLADSVKMRSRGTQSDIESRVPYRTQEEYENSVRESLKFRAELRLKTGTEDFYAYCFLAGFGPTLGPEGAREDLSPVYALFPDSPLMKYLNGTRATRENPGLLARLAADDPEFAEAFFHLGEAALGRRNLLSAESNFLKAEAGLRDSPQESIYLASIYTATEEFEKSLEYYDRTLALSPEYRDAFLGKAISLSYLGRSEEAIAILEKIVALGYWLLGEAHYWLAWNHHALKAVDLAQKNIEESKGRLPTNAEVFGLAGTIALEKGELDRSETEFKEALKYNQGHTEALFGLGRINDSRSQWVVAADYYERAAKVVGGNEAALRDKIGEIKSAPLAEDRRARMLAKKEAQFRIAQATRALALYNGAVGWLNAGFKDRARSLAEQAAAHPQFQVKASELLARMK